MSDELFPLEDDDGLPVETTWDKWKFASCYCHGGLVGGYDGYPSDCPSCKGIGGFYVTENGTVAEYPGGPLNGRDNDHSMWERGKPVETIVNANTGAPRRA